MIEGVKLVDGSFTRTLKSLKMVVRARETISEVLRSSISERLGGQQITLGIMEEGNCTIPWPHGVRE